MKYALSLADDGRVLSVTFEKYASEDAIIVETLPEGDASNYRYENGGFVYDPLPTPELSKPEITTEDVLNALLGVSRYE